MVTRAAPLHPSSRLGARRPRSLGQTVAQTLAGDGTLAGLLAQHRRSVGCHERLVTLLPEGLRALTRPGPIDGDTWTMLVESTAASAKLRQMLPTLEDALRRHDVRLLHVRLKVSPRTVGLD
jgi:hypothetical protein